MGDDQRFNRMFGVAFIIWAIWALIIMAGVVTGIVLVIEHFG